MSTLHDLADELTMRLGAPTGISDLQFDTLAAGPHPLDVDWVRRDSLLGRVAPNPSRAYFAERGVVPTMRGPVCTPADPDLGISARWVLPARCNGHTYGYIWVLLHASSPVTAEDVAEVQPLCDQVGAFLHRRRVQLRDHAARVRDLLTGHPEAARETASHLYDVADYPLGPVAVLVVNAVGPDGRRQALPTDILDGPFPRTVFGDVWRFVDGTRAVLLASPSTVARPGAVERAAEHARAITQREAPEGSAVVVGVGDAVGDLHEAGRSFRQARLAARAAGALDSVPAVAAWADLGAVRALLSIPEAQLDDAIAPGVRALCAQAPFLAETAEAYFATGGNVPETADRLSVSRGTVYYRLQRVETVSGLSLRSGPDRMTLQLGLTMVRLRDRTAVPGLRAVAEAGSEA